MNDLSLIQRCRSQDRYHVPVWWKMGLPRAGLIDPMVPPAGPMPRMMISGSDIFWLEPALIQFISSYVLEPFKQIPELQNTL